MAKILVTNPPHRRKRRRHRVHRNVHKKRRFSAKARAAAMRNLRKARAKLFHKNPNKISRRKRRRTRHKTLKRRRHYKRPSFKNPFMGELALVGNPGRRHRRRKHHMARRHKRRRTFSNPAGIKGLISAPREMIKGSFVVEAAWIAGGFVLPGMVLGYVPGNIRGPQRWKYYVSKVATIAVVAVAAGMASKRARRLVLLGGGVSLLLDVWTDFVSMRGGITGVRGVDGTEAFYGNPGMPGVSAYYGTPGVGDDVSDVGWTDDDMA
jgi:hypothetical protein